ncbi:transmembrane protein 242 [Lamellibrachia satsuma]|nr:transmembrane protein 242 [Lamellibrachia satsuma]
MAIETQVLDENTDTGTDCSKQLVKKSRTPEIIFLASVAGMSMMCGFGATLAVAKKKDPNFFTKGLLAGEHIPESGAALAMRALGWGTLYAVTGVGLICFGIWKLSGAKNMEDFRAKIPKAPKKETQGRNSFKNITELVDYIIHNGESKKS